MNGTHIIGRMPVLILNPHNRCNCRCVMCDIWKLEGTQEISFSDLESHLRDIEALDVRWVVFSGGEPLMHSDLFRLSGALREQGIRCTILSTGLLLKKKALSVVHGVDDVIVSLDGPPREHDLIRGIPGAFDLLAAGVRTLHELSPGFRIAARCTVQRRNFPFLRETVRTARRLGLCSISFLAADVTSEAFNRTGGWDAARQAEVALTEQETIALDEEIERLIADLPECGGFVLETPEKLRRIVRHFRSHLGLAEPVAPRCNAPWVSAVIEADGTVRPCFFHKPVGNITDGRLREVLNGRQAIEFRSRLDVSNDPTCRRCVCSLYLKPDNPGL